MKQEINREYSEMFKQLIDQLNANKFQNGFFHSFEMDLVSKLDVEELGYFLADLLSTNGPKAIDAIACSLEIIVECGEKFNHEAVLFWWYAIKAKLNEFDLLENDGITGLLTVKDVKSHSFLVSRMRVNLSKLMLLVHQGTIESLTEGLRRTFDEISRRPADYFGGRGGI